MRHTYFVLLIVPIVTFAALPAATVQTGSKDFVHPGPNNDHPFKTIYFLPRTVTRVKIECYGPVGQRPLVPFPSAPYYGGAGGGSYATATFDVNPGADYGVEITRDYAAALIGGPTKVVNATSGIIATDRVQGGKGGRAADCVGTTKLSGGDGGKAFLRGVDWLLGGYGGTAGPTVAGGNGTDATAAGAGIDGKGAVVSKFGMVRFSW